MPQGHWKRHAERAENHAMALAEQCEFLQHENHELEERVDYMRSEMVGLENDLKAVSEHRDQLWHELQVAYDLIQEGLAQNSSYDYDARANAFIEKHTAR